MLKARVTIFRKHHISPMAGIGFYFITLLIILSATFHANSQTAKELNIIRETLSKPQNDTIQVNNLLKYGRYYLQKPGELKNDLDSALLLSAQARNLSTSLHYDLGIGQSIFLDGEIYRESGKRDLAWKSNEAAVSFFTTHHMPLETGRATRAFAAFFDNSDDGVNKKITYTEKAIALMEQKGNTIDLAFALQDLGDYYQMREVWAKSLKALEKSLAVYNAVGYKQIQGVTSLLGFVYHRDGQEILALKYELISERVALSVHDGGMQLCAIYNRLGITYYELEKKQQALYYYRKAARIAEINKDVSAFRQIKFNIAILLIKLQKPEQSLKELKKLSEDYPQEDNGAIITNAYLKAIIYMDLKRYNIAKIYVDSLGRLREKYPAELGYDFYYIQPPIRYYVETNQFTKALKHLKASDTLIKSNSSFLLLHMQNEKYWSQVDSAMGNLASSLTHYKVFKRLSDSIKNETLRNQLAKLQVQFDVENKNQHIAVLTQNSQLQASKIRVEFIYRRIYIAGIVILFIFLGLAFNRNRMKTRNTAILEKKQAEINKQNETQKNLLLEKEWLLKEIHHRVKNNLQIVISLLNTQSSYLDNEDALSAIKNSQHRMQAMSLIHQRLYQTENIGKVELPSYIQELMNYLRMSFGQDQLIDFKHDLAPISLDVATAVPLGLILNEAISNSIKYAFTPAKRGEISVTLKEIDQGKVLLKIADNGVGLPVDFDPSQSTSLGMTLMMGLTEQIGGSFKIMQESGMVIHIEFSPYNIAF